MSGIMWGARNAEREIRYSPCRQTANSLQTVQVQKQCRLVCKRLYGDRFQEH